MPLTDQQKSFLERYLGITIPEAADSRDAAGPVVEPRTDVVLSIAQATWSAALAETLPKIGDLAEKLRNDPDPVGAEIADFIKDCIGRIESPLKSLSDVEGMETYLSSGDDIEILEEDNPYGKLSVKEPLLAALEPLKKALSA